MDLKILGVYDANTDNERLTLSVVNDCNVSNYIVMDTTYDDEREEKNVWRHALTLPDLEVKKGDQVKIYTRKGTNRSVLSNSGKCFIHFVYWGLNVHIWNKDGDIAYLFEISDCENKTINENN